MERTALITGASAGIGEATARCLAATGLNLILTARRLERLTALAQELTSSFGITVATYALDVCNREAVASFTESLKTTRVDILVNNAGLAAGLASLDEGSIDDWEQMIDTNIKGLLYITRGIAPLMVRQGSGHIINIGSIAGREVYPNGNVYCATKHAVHALSEGLRMELFDKGIKVMNIAPGLVETEFSMVRFKGDADRATKVYADMEPLTARDIADCILFCVTRPAHVNIADMLVLPSDQGASTMVKRGK
ncbi:MAG: SDR family NAD(P)-dependent oxidoreductase [Flavobacteriales bacterium]|nr:SDR family NAD(P)-dependent oxidoreductase [Flavobacteriales bacterium]